MKSETNGFTTNVVPWPQPISEVGMFGIAGKFVRLVAPHTEADPNILLLSFLAYAGNLLGRQFFIQTGADHHCPNLYLCVVGPTGSGRKGSAVAVVETFFCGKNGPRRGKGHLLHGISTGEGLIWEIHDKITKREYDKKSGRFEDIPVEDEIPDKRLLIYLSEFHQCIAAMRRQDSILSSVFRQAWDKDTLSAPAKNNPAKSTGAMVSIVGCITADELLRQTDAADAENGTLNRFLYACSRRSKLLPQGGRFWEVQESDEWRNLQQELEDNIRAAAGDAGSASVRFTRDDESTLDWGLDEAPDRGLYKPLSQARAGLWGAVTVRGPQQVMRLSLITATINGYREIRREHQDAGAEQWRYCDESAKYIFGKIENPIAGQIMNALLAVAPTGLTQSSINRIWNGKKPAEEIRAALTTLAHSGIARLEVQATSGRSTEMWYAN